MTTVALTPFDLVLSASLLLINAAISWTFGLRLERSFAVAAARMVVQVTLIGLVLKFIFAQTSPLWTLALVLVMAAAAGVEVVTRHLGPLLDRRQIGGRLAGRAPRGVVGEGHVERGVPEVERRG